MNLCLRLLVSYYDYKKNNIIPNNPESNFNRFEIHMGVILDNLWQHIETLQTVDKYLLLNHIADVLKTTIKEKPTTNLEFYQPSMICSYLQNVASNIECLIVEEYILFINYSVMPVIQENDIINNLIIMLTRFDDLLGGNFVHKGIEALSLLMETDEFKLEPNAYINEEGKKYLVDMDTTLIPTYCKDPKDKTLIRCLTDYINKVKRVLYK